jgi:hypothetical protein
MQGPFILSVPSRLRPRSFNGELYCFLLCLCSLGVVRDGMLLRAVLKIFKGLVHIIISELFDLLLTRIALEHNQVDYLYVNLANHTPQTPSTLSSTSFTSPRVHTPPQPSHIPPQPPSPTSPQPPYPAPHSSSPSPFPAVS